MLNPMQDLRLEQLETLRLLARATLDRELLDAVRAAAGWRIGNVRLSWLGKREARLELERAA